MKPIRIITLMLLPLMVTAYSPFRGASKSAKTIDVAVDTEAMPLAEFDPHELLDSRSRKSDIYNKAMLELKRLEEEPICHRVAVQLLMNNCQGLEESGDGDYQMEGAQLQRHHVESFAASLAICDLERGRFDIPQACTLFTSVALSRASRDIKGKLRISPDQVGECMEALGQHHSHWNTWLSYRDKTLLFCRASRLDIDKDQAILQSKELTRIMAEFATGLENDLQAIKDSMAEHARSTNAYFDGVKSHSEQLKAKILHSVELISTDFREAASTVKNSFSITMDIQRALKQLFDTAIQGNAEMASEQEKAVAINTQHTKSELEGLSALVLETKDSVAMLTVSIARLVPAVQLLNERQDDLAKRSEDMGAAMLAMIAIAENHTQDLQQASVTVQRMQESLEKGAEYAKTWSSSVIAKGPGLDWAFRVGGPIVGVMVGGYGIAARTTIQNAQLMFSGYVFGESVVQFRHWSGEWFFSSWHWNTEPTTPRTSTQQAQAVHASKAAETEEFSSEPHIDMV